MSRRRSTVHFAPGHVAFDTRVFWKECRSLEKAGYDVSLVVPHTGDEVVEGIKIMALPQWSGLRGRIRNAFRCGRIALSSKADILHVHDAEMLPVAIVAGLMGRRVVLDLHEDYPLLARSRSYIPRRLRPLAAWIVGLIEKSAARTSAAVITAEDARSGRFGRKKPVAIRNYLLTEELAELAPGAWDERDHAIIYVGAISPERGLVEMVDAVGAIPDKAVELRLVGEMKKSFRELITRSPGAAATVQLGRLDRSGTCEELRRARIGLIIWHPTPKHTGGAVPVKLFEYLGAGLPVVASDFPEIRRVVDTSASGLLVDPLDADAIAVAVAWLLDHPAEAEAMGRRGRDAVGRHYTWDSEVRALSGVYRQVVASAGSA